MKPGVTEKGWGCPRRADPSGVLAFASGLDCLDVDVVELLSLTSVVLLVGARVDGALRR